MANIGWDSVVDIATCYKLDSPDIISGWVGRGAMFSAPVQAGPQAHQASLQWVLGLFPGVKWQGHGINCPPSSITEVKERVELYVYSPFGPSWPVLGCTLPWRSFFKYISL